VADRIASQPDGSTWFVELKTRGGRLSPLQVLFSEQVLDLKQKYAVLWTTDQVDQWLKS
jgi:hypothetical protein